MSDGRPETSQDELREIARGARRILGGLEAAGFVGGLGSAGQEPLEQEPTAPLPDGVAEPSASRTGQLPLVATDDDPTRRTLASRRGENTMDANARKAALTAIGRKVSTCTLCRLCEGRTNAVPGEGSASARVMFVGEGPGATEDAQGRPFVGRAGQLLTKIIESGMGLSRSDVFIANVVKCRPPENRDPQPDEVAACLPFLQKQIEVVDPEVIIPLGRHSMRELAGVGERDTIGRVRGKVYRVNGRAVIPTYHPAYLLRNPPEKVKVWHDIQLAMKELGLPIPRNES